MDAKEARDFLKNVRDHAKSLSLNATAKMMNISVPTFNARLLKAAAVAREIPPSFSGGKSKGTKMENRTKVVASGRGGASKKIVIPQQIFEDLGWEIGDDVKLRVYGKRKLIIDRLGSEEDDDE